MHPVTIAKKLRHAPGLRRLGPVWQLLRPAYHRVIDPFGRGVPIQLGCRRIRLPAAVLGTYSDWSTFEHESLAALAAWLDAQSDRPTLLDVGCSFGIITSFAVQLCPELEVIAFDSDLFSLRALEAVAPRAAQARVRRVYGLLGPAHVSGLSLARAVAATRQQMPAIAPREAITRSHFVCFGEPAAETVPQHQLDALLADIAFTSSVLLKCDVEGAELLVLRGASAILRRVRPTLLLSVHPSALPRYGHTVDDVAAFLQEHDYHRRFLARDHEEHWWCEPITQ